MSDALTNGVRVQVLPTYHPERSRPQARYWFFSYRVRISNVGEAPVQLLARHWIITDADGKVQEVRGPGVVGEQPVLGPGESHQYSSFCPLGTSFGTMHGTYEMVTDAGETFHAEIAPFALGEPYSIN